MTEQLDFLTRPRYPNVPGSKVAGTSAAAAQDMLGRAQTLRDEVLAQLMQHGPMTADEIAARLRESNLAIRPRCSELLAKGKIKDSGQRRRNESGKSAVVWKWVDPSRPF